MTAQELQCKPISEIYDFIRTRLAFKEDIGHQLRHYPQPVPGDGTPNDWYPAAFDKMEHRRFNMSGYDTRGTGSCTVHNMNILNEFADLGIYDNTQFLFLDFYKGTPTLLWRYWGKDTTVYEEEFSGMTTVDIIYNIFQITLWDKTNPRNRRRE